MIDFISDAHLLESQAKTMAAAAKVFKAKDPKDRPYETELVEQEEDGLVVKGTHRRSGLAREHRLPQGAVRVDSAYSELVEAYAKVASGHGRAAVRRRSGREGGGGGSFFAELRREVLELAREGVHLRASRGSAR